MVQVEPCENLASHQPFSRRACPRVWSTPRHVNVRWPNAAGKPPAKWGSFLKRSRSRAPPRADVIDLDEVRPADRAAVFHEPRLQRVSPPASPRQTSPAGTRSESAGTRHSAMVSRALREARGMVQFGPLPQVISYAGSLTLTPQNPLAAGRRDHLRLIPGHIGPCQRGR